MKLQDHHHHCHCHRHRHHNHHNHHRQHHQQAIASSTGERKKLSSVQNINVFILLKTKTNLFEFFVKVHL